MAPVQQEPGNVNKAADILFGSLGTSAAAAGFGTAGPGSPLPSFPTDKCRQKTILKQVTSIACTYYAQVFIIS